VIAGTTSEIAETTDSTTDSGDGASSETSADTAVPDAIIAALSNASYPLAYAGSSTIQLTDGEFREPAAEDSAAEIVTQLTEHVTVGELINGEQAVAVILVTQTGGTGTFYDLVVMVEQDGQLLAQASTYLGDRIVVNSLSIEHDQIVIDMIVQGPEDPFCCPTQQVLQSYELQGEELVQTSSEIIGTVNPQSNDLPDITGSVWQWQELTTSAEHLAIDSPDKYTIEFHTDGQVSVLSDCNNGAGTYKISADQLSIDITSTTLTLCDPESHSDLFFRSLNFAASYSMEGDTLIINLQAGDVTMRFAKS